MDDTITTLVTQGKKKVKIQNDGFGLELFTMINGRQWTGQPVDEEMLRMIRSAINEHFGDSDNSVDKNQKEITWNKTK